MGIKKARDYFEKWGMEDRILEFDSSSATVELAAKAVACHPKRIAKTLAFLVEDKPILVVFAGDAKIDNKRFKAEFKSKAKMIAGDELLQLIGYEIGGVCPFGVNEGVEVYLDQSLKRFDSVYPACGSSNSAIELTIEELEKHSNYSSWVYVSKEWE